MNSRPDQSPSRWVINFHDWPLETAQTYSDCWTRIETLVKPERQRKNPNGEYALRKPLPQRYWQYCDKRPGLYKAIHDKNRVLVAALTSKYISISFQPNGIVYSHATVVIALDSLSVFTLLNSSLHDAWVRKYASTLETRVRYTPTDVFENFPFPAQVDTLEHIGNRYNELRTSIMREHKDGLTTTYNHFHNPQESAHDIACLRELHREMDEAVAAAYGWSDLDLGHGFHTTKQGVRYTISEPARREMLDRLLALNHQRYAEEVAAGLHDKGKKGGGGKGKGRGKKAGAEAGVQAGMFD